MERPRIRWIEAVPIDHEENHGLLRDTEGTRRAPLSCLTMRYVSFP